MHADSDSSVVCRPRQRFGGGLDNISRRKLKKITKFNPGKIVIDSLPSEATIWGRPGQYFQNKIQQITCFSTIKRTFFIDVLPSEATIWGGLDNILRKIQKIIFFNKKRFSTILLPPEATIRGGLDNIFRKQF